MVAQDRGRSQPNQKLKSSISLCKVLKVESVVLILPSGLPNLDCQSATDCGDLASSGSSARRGVCDVCTNCSTPLFQAPIKVWGVLCITLTLPNHASLSVSHSIVSFFLDTDKFGAFEHLRSPLAEHRSRVLESFFTIPWTVIVVPMTLPICESLDDNSNSSHRTHHP